MKPIVVIEAGHRLDASGEIRYRFVCSSCNEQGAWHPSLNDAERSGTRHNRVKHAEAVVA